MHHALCIKRRPSGEDDPQWKTTFSGRWPSVEDNLQLKTTFGGKRPSVEDDLRWKMTFSGRGPLVEEDLWWKRTFSGRRPSVEDDLQWNMAFSWRQPSLDPCMLPAPLCGIFWNNQQSISVKIFIVSYIRDKNVLTLVLALILCLSSKTNRSCCLCLGLVW